MLSPVVPGTADFLPSPPHNSPPANNNGRVIANEEFIGYQTLVSAKLVVLQKSVFSDFKNLINILSPAAIPQTVQNRIPVPTTFSKAYLRKSGELIPVQPLLSVDYEKTKGKTTPNKVRKTALEKSSIVSLGTWGKWMCTLIILSQFMMILKMGMLHKLSYRVAFLLHIKYTPVAHLNKYKFMNCQIASNVNIRFILKVA